MTNSPPLLSGPFGRGGDVHLRVLMVFAGDFNESFRAFITERAARLGVRVSVDLTPDSATVLAEGSDAMIGALEMAAAIGPEDCAVHRWSCKAAE